jgi:predicted ATPase/DNA-binding CsgD family transcriptional regulator/uncharacterized protein HemY
MSYFNHDLDFPGNLPLPLSSFIGRKREITAVRRLLSEHRLLTLTGVGGSGKTRLALHVAGDLQPKYKHGVWLVEFGSLAEAKLVPQLVATILGVREQAGQLVTDSLISFLHSRNVLLVLDNCEHLAEACARLTTTLLETCPHVHILATSREPLRIPGEVVWIVPPLSLPERQPWQSPAGERESLSAYMKAEAFQLFVDRAVTASPTFSLNAENGPWVANICRRLDGLPLAIELAAAHLRFLSVRQIAEHLDDRFQLLSSSLRATPERHQTLKGALDWSYALLTDTEKKILNQLSVFANGWTLGAAKAVCNPGKGKQFEVMTSLSNLVDKSLVVVKSSNGSKRYHLLETIRQYAQQKMLEGGDDNDHANKNRHLAYFVQWAEAAALHLAGPEQLAWLEKFDIEHDNLRAAHEWSINSQENAQKGLRLAAACGHFWRLRGHLSEGRVRLASALEAAGAQEQTAARASALLWAANLAYLQSDYEASRLLAEEGLAINSELGPEGAAGVAKAHDLLGELATEVGDYESARVFLEDALNSYRKIGDRRGSADMLMQRGWAAMREGDFGRASALLNESLTLFRELGESAMLGIVLAGLGELAVRQGWYDQADELLEDSLALRRELGDQWGIAGSLGTLGWAALLQRDFTRTRDLLRQSLEIRLEISDKGGIAWCLEKLGEAAALEARKLPAAYRRQMRQRAVRILGAAAAVRKPLNSVIDPADKPHYDRMLLTLRRSLGVTAFDTAWEKGRQMALQEIIDSASAPALTASGVADLSNAQADKMKYGGLTPRERETAVLIAHGKSNREIAAEMTVRVKTIETYVTRILNKLGFDTRVQIATWALQIGLTESDTDNS